MNDSELLARIVISGGDLHTADAVYHKDCYTKYYTQVRSKKRIKATSENERVWLSTQAIHHGVSYIAHSNVKDSCSIFELEDMYIFYTQCLKSLIETNSESAMNRTRFK